MTIEDRYAELEAAGEERQRARMRRQPLLLIGLVGALVLGIGVTASIDLRRLQTPQGVGLRWAQATVFGDCDDYFEFSLPDGPETRSRGQVCQDLRAATADARNDNLRIGLAVSEVTTSGSTAEVRIVLTRERQESDLVLVLVRRDGSWKVLRDSRTCGSVGCA